MNANIARVTLVGVCLASALASADGQSGGSLAALTVPVSALPAGCALKLPDPAPAPGIRTLIGGLVSAPPTNPWSGSDRVLAASVRRRIDATPRVPDGSPVDAADARAWELKWADNVAEAYRATYRAADDSLVDVFAVRFNDAGLVREGPIVGTRPPPRRLVSRVILGPSVAVIEAPADSECFKAINRHIQALR